MVGLTQTSKEFLVNFGPKAKPGGTGAFSGSDIAPWANSKTKRHQGQLISKPLHTRTEMDRSKEVVSTTDHEYDNNASRSQIGGPSLNEKMVPTLIKPSDLSGKNADVDLTVDLNDGDDRTEDRQSEDIDQNMLDRMLKFDANTWRRCHKKEFGSLDFIGLKTKEFLAMQKKLGSLDYNSLNSDRKNIVDHKIDFMMKDIAISASKKYGRMAD